jgi:hypothetical protein
VPSTAKLGGTVIRGLSAISYGPAHQLYYVISDDKSQYNAARFYTARIPLSGRGIDAVDFVTTPLSPTVRLTGAGSQIRWVRSDELVCVAVDPTSTTMLKESSLG